MPMQDLTLMSAMLTKMNWMEERQKVIAQNIANADTPGYQPMDIKPLDFKNLLKGSTSAVSLGAASGSAAPAPASHLLLTDDKHIGGSSSSEDSNKLPTSPEKSPYEVSPAGNGVILEEQLVKMNQNFTDYQFTSNLYQKNMDMLKSALK